MAHEDYFASVVALRQDADQFMVGNDQQSTNPVLRHLLNRFIDRLVGLYRYDFILLFAFQYCLNRVRKFHQTSYRSGYLPGCGYENPGFTHTSRNKGMQGSVLIALRGGRETSRLNRRGPPR